MTKVKLGLIQTHAELDASSNLQRTLALIDDAAAQGAQVVVLQELFLGPYFPQEEDPDQFDRAEAVPGPTTDALCAKAGEHGIVLVGGSIFERRAKGVHHNTSVCIDADGTLLGTYRKMHIPDDPRFHEKFYFAPGDQGFQVFDTRFGKVGTLICWDQWYPEAARACALKGADLIVYPTAIATWQGEEEYTEEQRDAWRTVQQGHAVANNVFVAAVNRVGTEGELDFWGHSFVADPAGRILHEAGESEEVAVVELDMDHVEQWRRGWPFLRDRRIDAYASLLKRFDD